MSAKVYEVDAFIAEDGSGGNKAGVVLAAESMTEKDMQCLAAEVGFSETAFVSDVSAEGYRVRFFTPTDEVDLCGHATVAAAALLYRQRLLTQGRFIQITKAGNLAVEIMEDGMVFMEQTMPRWGKYAEKKLIASSLGITEDDLHPVWRSQVVSTGLPDIIIPINSQDVLMHIEPDFSAIKRVSELYDTVGYHLLVLTADGKVICRNFAPRYGINEESATGTASGATACYLHRCGALMYNAEKQVSLTFHQGESMNMPARIYVQLSLTSEREIDLVQVGGYAAVQI